MNLSEELRYLNMIHIDQKNIASKLLPEVQYLVLKELKPSDKELISWRCSIHGRDKFKRYLDSFFDYELSEKFISFAWDYYNHNTNNGRSKSKKEAFLKLQHDDLKCRHCGRIDPNFEVDHKIPLSKGGKDEVDNMQILCRACNRIKSNRFDYKMNLLLM